MRYLYVILFSAGLCAQSISFTFDDGPSPETFHLTPQKRNKAILGHLHTADLQSILFLCSKDLPSERLAMVKSWGIAGHGIANHSATHPNFSSEQSKAKHLKNEILACDAIIRNLPGYTARFRFPYLKEGKTAQQRDAYRKVIKALGYQPGAVSVDASDWYYDQRLKEALAQKPDLDLAPWRKIYLDHLLNRARYYESLSIQTLGRSAKHVLLLHHNLINALFLGDAIQAFKAVGWKTISAKEAFQDPLYAMEPSTLPAGESILWSLAKGKGIEKLRHPAEDGQYEKTIIDGICNPTPSR